jgi:hypothetical protein
MSDLLANKGKTKLRKLLGESAETEYFINEAERAISTYFAVKNADEKWLSEGALSNPKDGKYTRARNQSRKLWKSVNEIPGNQWGLIGQHWLLRHGEFMPFDQLELIELLQKLAIATDEAIGDSQPANRGRKQKSENWFFIDGLAKTFKRSFPEHKISRSNESYFLQAVVTVCKNSDLKNKIKDPEQVIRTYKNNSGNNS